jgi:hypothetical protein
MIEQSVILLLPSFGSESRYHLKIRTGSMLT